MNDRRSFQKKIGYFAAIAVLWLLVSLISQPARIEADGTRSPGGLMAQKRADYQLSQTALGNIDPSSETAKLATLGLRGVAVQLLWNSAQHYQKVEDWNSLTAVLEQIIRLQPNFVWVWDFQAHNLSYNISVEFDDYRDRFYWVMKGIEFLKTGVEYNSVDPRFLDRIGWFYGNKIGRADERVQYRALFKKQQEEKGEKLTDNWLVAHSWYKRGQELVDSGKRLRVHIGGHQGYSKTKPGERARSPLLFHVEIPMSLMNYAETIEEEGVFGDTAKAAWQNAAADWNAYINRDLASSYGYSVHLADLEGFRGRVETLKQQLEALVPGERDRLYEAKAAKLTPQERAAVAKHYLERSAEESVLASEAGIKTAVTWEEVALQAPAETRTEARDIAAEIADLEQKVSTIDTYRGIVNYDYWNERCRVEPMDACLEARQLMHEANQAYRETELLEARRKFEAAFKKWDEVLQDSPILRTNSIMADDLVEEIEKYKKLLGQLTGEELPDDFVLQYMIDLHEGRIAPDSHAGHDHAGHDHAEHDHADDKDEADNKTDARKDNEKKDDAKKDDSKNDETKASETKASETPDPTPADESGEKDKATSETTPAESKQAEPAKPSEQPPAEAMPNEPDDASAADAEEKKPTDAEDSKQRDATPEDSQTEDSPATSADAR